MEMRRRVVGKGFYSEDLVEEREEESGCLEVRGGDMVEGVYEVERVVERRRRRVSIYFKAAAAMFCMPVFQGRAECLVLWAGYWREEASWVAEREVTAAALRSVISMYFIVIFLYLRYVC